jgi:hypothetical protein
VALRAKIGPDEAEPEGCGGSTAEGENEVWPDFHPSDKDASLGTPDFRRNPGVPSTTCPPPDGHEAANDMVDAQSNGTCGTASTNGQASGAFSIPIRTSQTWHEDLAVVSDLVLSLRSGAHK